MHFIMVVFRLRAKNGYTTPFPPQDMIIFFYAISRCRVRLW